MHGTGAAVALGVGEQLGEAAGQVTVLDPGEARRQCDPGAQLHAVASAGGQQLLEIRRARPGRGAGLLLLPQQGEHGIELPGRAAGGLLDGGEGRGGRLRVPGLHGASGGGLDAHHRQGMADAVVQLARDAGALGLAVGTLPDQLEAILRRRPQEPGREAGEHRTERPPGQQRGEADQRRQEAGARPARRGVGQHDAGAQRSAEGELREVQGGRGHEGREQRRDQQAHEQMQRHPGAGLQVVAQARAPRDQQLPVGPQHAAGPGDLELPHAGHRAQHHREQQAGHDDDRPLRAGRHPATGRDGGQHEHQQHHREADGGARHQPREAATLPTDGLHRAIVVDHARPAPGITVEPARRCCARRWPT